MTDEIDFYIKSVKYNYCITVYIGDKKMTVKMDFH